MLDAEGKAILHYAQTPLQDPISIETGTTLLDPFTLLPFDKTLIAPESTTDYRLMFAIVPNELNESRAYVEMDGDFDYSEYIPPHIPTLFTVASGQPVNISANVVKVDKGEVVDLTIYNDDAMPHTFHLHG